MKPTIRFIAEKALSPMVQMIGSKQYEAQQAENKKRAHYLNIEAARLLHIYESVFELVTLFEEKEARQAMQLFKLHESEVFYKTMTNQFIELIEKHQGNKEASRLLQQQAQIVAGALKMHQNESLLNTSA